MKKIIKLSENDLRRIVLRVIREQEEIEMDFNDGDEEMEFEDEEETMGKGEVVDLIANFFEKRVLPKLDDDQVEELEDMASSAKAEALTEMFISENLSDRMKSFKEKTMIGGGLGTMVTGMIAALGEFTGWSDFEITQKIHEYVEMMGAGRYSGPITVAMVVAGLVLALKGVADRHYRTGK